MEKLKLVDTLNGFGWFCSIEKECGESKGNSSIPTVDRTSITTRDESMQPDFF